MLVLAIDIVTLPDCQQDKRKVLYSEELQHEMSQCLIQLQIPYLHPQGLLHSQTVCTSESFAAHTVKKSKANILQSIMSKNPINHKILSTAYGVFFLMAFQLFGTTFALLSLKLKMLVSLMES